MNFDIVIIGAGPAGLAAAAAALQSQATVALIDDNPAPGGQIWRAAVPPGKTGGDARAGALWDALAGAARLTCLFGMRVVAAPAPQHLLLEAVDGARSLRLGYQRLIVCSGARELLLPFPGWTLPGVTGAGALQALAKRGYPVAGKRVIVAGSGPLLLACAASLAERGARVSHILEQAPLSAVLRFGAGLWRTPSKLQQAWQLWRSRAGVRYLCNTLVRAVQAGATGLQVDICSGDDTNVSTRRLECDYLACAWGLVPNSEIAAALGCARSGGRVVVDDAQCSSDPQVYCAGEITGIGGVELALAEGRIAGLAASGQWQNLPENQRRQLFRQRRAWQAFAARVARHFALQPAVRALPRPETLVCRCEDVRLDALAGHADWRSARLHSRCGMGACQGRICGAACAVLFGWDTDGASRPPLAPTKIANLIEAQHET